MVEKYKKAIDVLEKYNQKHVLKNFEKLEEKKKEKLLEQILSIDFEQIQQLYESTKKQINFVNEKIEPIEYVDKTVLSSDILDKYNKLGEKEIKDGKYAVVTMAGGQGTRLGHSGPKGTFKLGLKDDKSIFEILITTLKDSNEKYNVVIPWYIMTSRENNEQTVKFFEENNYFGYDKNSIIFSYYTNCIFPLY